MRAKKVLEQYKRKNSTEFKKLKWNIPFQVGRLWLKIELWLSR